jgi:hypothetical protein
MMKLIYIAPLFLLAACAPKQCVIPGELPTGALRERVKHADRIEISALDPDWSPCSNRVTVITAPNEISNVISGIVVADIIHAANATPGYVCCCLGEAHLTFLNGTNHLITMSTHHCKSLRREEGAPLEHWCANEDLTPESRLFVSNLLVSAGILRTENGTAEQPAAQLQSEGAPSD